MGVSQSAASFVLGLVAVILRLAFATAGVNGPPNASQEHILRQIPLTIESVLSRFKLDGKMTTYAVCPKCHCTYKPQITRGSATMQYPKVCTNIPVPELGTCDEPLLQADLKPIKTFEYYSFHDYLAGLLSRGDLESLMDQSCDDFRKSFQTPRPDFTTDILEADFARSFEGPTPGELFLDGGNEGRYAFSLNVDFFNIEGMRIRGASTSCGIISMACLNLPIDIRYKPENMYLAGIIPGPREPHLTELNHYIRPLIDDMFISWDQGVYISRTALCPDGRATRSAIFAAVNDLPGARKMAALANTGSHYFCTICQCYHKRNLGACNHGEWVKRDVTETRRHAEDWKMAKTLKDQERLFKAHGVRWSEMWRLPYWDPSRQLVVDAMHCILEGLVQHHFRVVLKLSTTESLIDPEAAPAFEHSFRQAAPDDTSHKMTEKELKHVIGIHKSLRAPVPGNNADEIDTSLASLARSLHGRNLKPLRFVCSDLGITLQNSKPTKQNWTDGLIAWVSYTQEQ